MSTTTKTTTTTTHQQPKHGPWRECVYRREDDRSERVSYCLGCGRGITWGCVLRFLGVHGESDRQTSERERERERLAPPSAARRRVSTPPKAPPRGSGRCGVARAGAGEREGGRKMERERQTKTGRLALDDEDDDDDDDDRRRLLNEKKTFSTRNPRTEGWRAVGVFAFLLGIFTVGRWPLVTSPWLPLALLLSPARCPARQPSPASGTAASRASLPNWARAWARTARRRRQ